MSAAWGFWIVEGRPAYARAQLASDPASVEQIERWGRTLGGGTQARPLVALLPAACACDSHDTLLRKLDAQAAKNGLQPRRVERPRLAALPAAAGLVLFSAEGRLLYAGPLQSPLHCSSARSLAELVLERAHDASPPLWAPVLDEPCACLPLTA